MTTEDYINAVRACPRATWQASSWSLSSFKRREYTETGYVVGRRRGGKVALVPATALADEIACGYLASRSTCRRIAGCIIVRTGDITFME